MMPTRRLPAILLIALAGFADPAAAQPRTSAEILAASAPSDWRGTDPAQTLVMQLAGGKVVIELAPAFAPQHVANIRLLAQAHYYDGLAIVRVQDNYVVQWGDPDGKKPLGAAKARLAGEFYRAGEPEPPFTPLPDGDAYAPQVGHSQGLPAARNRRKEQTWLAHCYGMVGVGRDNAADSGNGAELYVVLGHAPRHLDRNVTLVGRVLQGMELLSSLPRGTGALGFYEDPAQTLPIQSLRLASELPEPQRPRLQVLRTDTETWSAYVEARRNRREEWFIEPTGHIELCNLPAPVREGSSEARARP